MEFIKGMDISMTAELESLGVKFFDKGKEEDIFSILKKYNTDTIRLRLWHNPYDEEGNPYGGGTNDLETTLNLAKRIKNAGMKFLLDIHYSDFGVDPEKQFKPKAWRDIEGQDLCHEVYKYTCEVLKEFINKDICPEMIQVGNELTNGLLWPEGNLENPDEMIELIKSGIKAVKDTAGNDIKIILHLDNGGNNELYRRWFDIATERNVEYDFIGLSYYPYWHGLLNDLKNNLNDISERYNKDVIIVETSYSFTTEPYKDEYHIVTDELASITGYEPSKEGQSKFINDLLDVIKNVNNNRGKGFFYWEPSWVPVKGTTWATKAGMKYINNDSEEGNAWANQALFDYEGNALPALEIIRDFR